MEESQRNKKLDLLKNQCEFLRKNFDGVQIFASVDEPGEKITSQYVWGEGNWHTRYGLVREWVTGVENSIKHITDKE